MRFEIISPGYNCRKYVDQCVQSVLGQSYSDWRLHLISDGSTDNTDRRISLHADDKKIFAYVYNENLFATFRRYQAIKMIKDPNCIVLLLDLDDMLLPGCLEKILALHQAGKWMTYGNWINQEGVGLPKDFSLHFSDEVHQARSYRKDKYRSTHARSFRRFLFDQFTDEDFKMDGDWIKTATEGELMLSLLEMCGKERIGVIEDPIYLYRTNLPNNSQARYGQAYKNEVYRRITERPKRALYEGSLPVC